MPSRTPRGSAAQEASKRGRAGLSSVAAASLPSASGRASSSSAARAATEVGNDDFVWSCRICSLELRDPSKRRLGKLRTWHIANRHKGKFVEA